MDKIGFVLMIVVAVIAFIAGVMFLIFGANEWTIITRLLFLLGQWVVGFFILAIIENI